jgi:hypothetical protein
MIANPISHLEPERIDSIEGHGREERKIDCYDLGTSLLSILKNYEGKI